MPKMKTHRGAAKRLKATASGKLRHKQPGHSHLLTGKARKVKRQQRRPNYVAASELRNLKRLVPYL